MYITNELLVFIWQKGRSIPGYDAAVWRHDSYGAVMNFSSYGNRSSEYGWEVDHVIPEARGGSDHPSNLRPLNWKNNAAKSDKKLPY